MDPSALRRLVRDCLAKHMLSSAVFFADKLLCLSNRAPEDVLLLANVYFTDRQYGRALLLLRTSPSFGTDYRFKYLSARCLEHVKRWQECLAVLGDIEDDHAWPDEDITAEPMTSSSLDETSSRGGRLKLVSAVNLLRGRAFEALGNRVKSVQWFCAALMADPFCSEAFDELVDRHMLTGSEEQELVASLPLQPHEEWLRQVYLCRIKQYGREYDVAVSLRQLEDSAAAASLFDPEADAGAVAPGRTDPSLPAPDARAGREADRKGKRPASAEAGPLGGGGCAAEQDAPRGAIEAGGVPAAPSLAGSMDVGAARVSLLYHCGLMEEAYALSTSILERDPFHSHAMVVHLAAGAQLGRRNDLFLRAHQLVDALPKSALSWFAVGCYYFCIRHLDQTRRYFCKATVADPSFAPGWIGFGHTYAAQDETDQAMVAYRTAARLFAGFHLPLVCIGMEYERSNNLSLAHHFLVEAHKLCPHDPLVENEMGVVAYRNRDFVAAATHFEAALSLAMTAGSVLSSRRSAWQGGQRQAGGSAQTATAVAAQNRLALSALAPWDATLLNLGHTYRKLKRLDDAITTYQKCLALDPNNASTLAALAFTNHLQGNLVTAIELYHKSLAVRPNDSLCAELLTLALRDECEHMACSADEHINVLVPSYA